MSLATRSPRKTVDVPFNGKTFRVTIISGCIRSIVLPYTFHRKQRWTGCTFEYYAERKVEESDPRFYTIASLALRSTS